ncbi:MAG: DUF86 domain-containing protein [Anaerolineales bacterium]|jgi:uncharacterized protein with HEPN domain
MSSRKPDLYLEDIQQACSDILNFTQTIKSADELQNDRRTFLAVVRCLEIIGEAARQMPKSFREKHPEFPWRETASLRNVIAHEYFGLDIDIIWDVVHTRIPVLLEQVKQLAEE